VSITDFFIIVWTPIIAIVKRVIE